MQKRHEWEVTRSDYAAGVRSVGSCLSTNYARITISEKGMVPGPLKAPSEVVAKICPISDFFVRTPKVVFVRKRDDLRPIYANFVRTSGRPPKKVLETSKKS